MTQTLGEKLKARRKELGLSREKVAYGILCSKTIQRIETDPFYTPSWWAVCRIAKKLGLSLDALDTEV